MKKIHPIEKLLRKKKKILLREKISLKDAKKRKEACKSLRQVDWNKFELMKCTREYKVTSNPWYSPDALTKNLNHD